MLIVIISRGQRERWQTGNNTARAPQGCACID
jgi:hypothetical protein